MKTIIDNIVPANVITKAEIASIEYPIIGGVVSNTKGWLQPDHIDSKTYRFFSVNRGVSRGIGWSNDSKGDSISYWFTQHSNVQWVLFDSEQELFKWLADSVV